MVKLSLVATSVLMTATLPCQAETTSGIQGPWIGILGLPAAVECDSMLQDQQSEGSSMSCFSNVYDKWVQAAGARAVGIPFDAFERDRSSLDALLGSVDGVIFTGGGLKLSAVNSSYYRTGRYIFDWVKRTNDQGKFFPLHGHCMGFQFLTILAAGDNASVLTSNAFDSENLALPLEWTQTANDSRWVQRMPQDVYTILTEEKSTTNLHHDGVTPNTFSSNPRLPEFFNVISTNHDRKQKAFVSTLEAKKYPILAVQWHPERNQFEWTPELNINHSRHAVAANSWVAFDFIDQARHRGRTTIRNESLLREFSTYAMKQVLADGDVLNGLTYMMYPSFGESAATFVI